MMATTVREIEEVIQHLLEQHVGRPVVMLEQGNQEDQAAPKPPYPFLGYKFTSSYIPQSGMPPETIKTLPSNDLVFDSDIQVTRTEMPTLTLSLTAYSKNIDQANELAQSAYDWFSFHGYDDLKSENLVVARQEPVGDRTVLLEILYEYRRGFDVILRFTRELKRVVDTIEQAEIERV